MGAKPRMQASQPATDGDRTLIRRLRGERRLPERREHASTDRMLDMVGLLADNIDGPTRYDANRTAEWLRRFPFKATAAVVEDWRLWPDQGRVQQISDAVLMHGWTAHETAHTYMTTVQTVHDVVRVARDKIRRSR